MKIITEDLGNAGCPKRATVAFREMKSVAPAYLETFKKITDRIGTGCLIGILGPRGTGKTVMAVGFINRSLNLDKSARYITAHTLFMEFKASYHATSEQTELDVMATLSKPSLLIIDEIGRRQDSDWENRTLFELLNRRYGDMKDTILISNQTEEVFKDAIGDSVVSRMNECGGFIECNWPSFRQ